MAEDELEVQYWSVEGGYDEAGNWIGEHGAEEEDASTRAPGAGATMQGTASPQVTEKETLWFAKNVAGSIIGVGGSRVKEVREKSGANVNIVKTDEHTQVDVTGTPEQLQVAKMLINEFAESAPAGGHPFHGGPVGSGEAGKGGGRRYGPQEFLKFDKFAAGAIIGTGGSRVKEIRATTGAEVNVNKTDRHCEVALGGTPQQIQLAKAMVLESVEAVGGPRGASRTLVEQPMQPVPPVQHMQPVQPPPPQPQPPQQSWQSQQSQQSQQPQATAQEYEAAMAQEDDEDTETLSVTRMDAMRVIGKGGEIVKLIRQQSGAHVKTDPEAEPCPVWITGTIQAVDKARAMINDLLYNERRKGQECDWEDEDYMMVSPEESKRVIGKQGLTVNHISDTTWAKVEVDKQGGERVMIRIAGSFDAVDKAHAMVVKALSGNLHWSNSGKEEWDAGGWGQSSWKNESWNGGGGQKRKWGESDWQQGSDERNWGKGGSWSKGGGKGWAGAAG